ncbi:MAG TPA: hypothetical protein VFV58_31880 [Blastocatellia bacterium]|jgi:DUF4097 and DUF4098 domain-containing protein YvlB|nr:hypothetical protein [Blastocatellia bacterium]
MRSKLVFALMAAAAIGLMLIARGCSGRKDSAATKVETANGVVAGDKSQSAEISISAKDDEGFDLPEREEIRQTRKLTPGTKVFIIGINDAKIDSDGKDVFVMGINGPVKVETADIDTAEILVVRSARTREDLRGRQVKISNNGDLFIQIEDDYSRGPAKKTVAAKIKKMFAHIEGGSSRGPVPDSRERVTLRLPLKTGLDISEVHGGVTVGDIRGRLEVRGVDGPVRVARAAGPIVVGGDVNGGVDITFAPLTDASIKICCDINGDVDLRFEGEVNADLYTWSVNGAIKPDLPNVKIRESGWGALKARKRIGNGGSVIEIHDVNGNVTLSKAENRDKGTEGQRDRGTER